MKPSAETQKRRVLSNAAAEWQTRLIASPRSQYVSDGYPAVCPIIESTRNSERVLAGEMNYLIAAHFE